MVKKLGIIGRVKSFYEDRYQLPGLDEEAILRVNKLLKRWNKEGRKNPNSIVKSHLKMEEGYTPCLVVSYFNAKEKLDSVEDVVEVLGGRYCEGMAGLGALVSRDLDYYRLQEIPYG